MLPKIATTTAPSGNKACDDSSGWFVTFVAGSNEPNESNEPELRLCAIHLIPTGQSSSIPYHDSTAFFRHDAQCTSDISTSTSTTTIRKTRQSIRFVIQLIIIIIINNNNNRSNSTSTSSSHGGIFHNVVWFCWCFGSFRNSITHLQLRFLSLNNNSNNSNNFSPASFWRPPRPARVYNYKTTIYVGKYLLIAHTERHTSKFLSSQISPLTHGTDGSVSLSALCSFESSARFFLFGV